MSMPSVPRGTLRVRNGNEPPAPEQGRPSGDCQSATQSRPSSSIYSQESDSSTESLSFELSEMGPSLNPDHFHEVDLNSTPSSSPSPKKESLRWRIFHQPSKIMLQVRPGRENNGACEVREEDDDAAEPREVHQPFKRWVDTMRRKSLNPVQTLAPSDKREPLEESDEGTAGVGGRLLHKKSTSFSSSAFVSAIRTASLSLASVNLPSRSRRSGPHSYRRSANRSSKSSELETRVSSDSKTIVNVPLLDEAVRKRAIQRRRIVEEMISSEESYIADMKILINVYFSLLASVPTLSQQTRASIQRNVSEILRLHEELLGELHQVVPNSEYNQDLASRKTVPAAQHIHWRGLDAVPEACPDAAPNHPSGTDATTAVAVGDQFVGLVAETHVAADVAKVFQKFMKRFFAYEEYGAKYEIMVDDVAASYKSIPTWSAYEKGIEALASSLTSINARTAQDHKGLTFGDLLIKPIQHMCRYPLLFADLAKQTPVCDCPEAHADIQKVLFRLRETVREINRATDDPKIRKKIEKTWLLQDKLIFPDKVRAVEPSNAELHLTGRCVTKGSQAIALRMLGHVTLCGVLHVVWQTNKGVDGAYMLCALFRSYLVLATSRKSSSTFDVVACISLNRVRLEKADNGKGLQCHTALFTWKMVFESDHHVHELMLSACSSKEETKWTEYIFRALDDDSYEVGDETNAQDFLSFLCLDSRPIGHAFGHRGTLARRMSIQRTTTVGPKTHQFPVIIKNTHNLLEAQDRMPNTSPTIIRSQSHLTAHRIPIVAPKRVERGRIEALLGDVWTRDVLPYPGMGSRPASHPIKVSATSMIRKLSIASLTSNFSRRSGSANNIVGFAAEEGIGMCDGTEGEAGVSTGVVHALTTHSGGSRTSVQTLTLSPMDSEAKPSHHRSFSNSWKSGASRRVSAGPRRDENGATRSDSTRSVPARKPSPSRLSRAQSVQGLTRWLGYRNH
ncbi:MAG: hypothetical protein M1838_001227 [Thelocarpon superellum]|nr:MAG: hypothetical protein M1838_001227 [Thelocarpon superellum]